MVKRWFDFELVGANQFFIFCDTNKRHALNRARQHFKRLRAWKSGKYRDIKVTESPIGEGVKNGR